MNNNGYRIVVDAGHLGTKFPKNNQDGNELGFINEEDAFMSVFFCII